MADIMFLIPIVAFWIALFIFAFWMSARALKVPTEADLEQAAREVEGAHSAPAR